MDSMISDVFRQRTAVKQIEKSWPSEIRTIKSQVEKLEIIGIFSSHQDFQIFDTLLSNSILHSPRPVDAGCTPNAEIIESSSSWSKPFSRIESILGEWLVLS